MTLTLLPGTRVVVNNGGVCPVQISDVFCAKFFSDYSLRKLAHTFSLHVRVIKNKFMPVAYLDAVPAASGVAAVAAVVNDNFSHNVLKGRNKCPDPNPLMRLKCHFCHLK